MPSLPYPHTYIHIPIPTTSTSTHPRATRSLPLEAIALIATVLMEMIRDGDRTVAALMDLGRGLLGHRQVGS